MTIKKDYSVVVLFRSHIDLCFLSIGLSLGAKDRSEERHDSLSVPPSSFTIMKMYIGASKIKL